jgi:ribonucleotide reductase alpha subunit
LHRRILRFAHTFLLFHSYLAESINEVDASLGLESKFGGGLATDFSALRSKGAFIEGNKGKSGGVVPFIQKNQWSVGAYNQGDTRASSECMYYNWFHYESPEITMLKDKSGKDEERARKLKYAIKWNRVLSRAILADEEITLFDPHKTQDMTFAYGAEFERLYEYYKTTKVRKRTYRAQDLAFTVAKVKGETGNNYTFFTDNANEQNIGAGTVNQANLCMEYLPNFQPIKHLSTDLVTINGKTKVQHNFDGDIALCNLASFNLTKWYYLSPAEKESNAYILVKSMDNCIDNSFYSNKYGYNHSMAHRNLGIGVSNYANLLALLLLD